MVRPISSYSQCNWVARFFRTCSPATWSCCRLSWFARRKSRLRVVPIFRAIVWPVLNKQLIYHWESYLKLKQMRGNPMSYITQSLFALHALQLPMHYLLCPWRLTLFVEDFHVLRCVIHFRQSDTYAPNGVRLGFFTGWADIFYAEQL